jgi:hypothetical protein
MSAPLSTPMPATPITDLKGFIGLAAQGVFGGLTEVDEPARHGQLSPGGFLGPLQPEELPRAVQDESGHGAAGIEIVEKPAGGAKERVVGFGTPAAATRAMPENFAGKHGWKLVSEFVNYRSYGTRVRPGQRANRSITACPPVPCHE